MKIAYIGLKGLPSKGGTERVVEAIVTRFCKHHQITLYCDARYEAPPGALPDVEIKKIKTLPGKYLQPTSLFLFSAIHALIFGDFDIVHIHGVETTFISPLLRLKFKRIMATAHGSPTRSSLAKWGKFAQFLMNLTEYSFLYASNISTSVSKIDANYFSERFNKDVEYIPNGVNQYQETLSESAKIFGYLSSIGVEKGKYYVFSAGRIIQEKGCHLAIEAINKLGLEEPLLIIGDLDQSPDYRKRLTELATRKVIFIPPISDRNLLFGIINYSKLFIFPSIREAMSMMLLEAASLGSPLVCSDILENKIVLGENAVYFKSVDVSDLCEKILWANCHPVEMAEISRKAKESVLEFFSWDKIARDYEKLYVQIMENHSRKEQVL